MYEFDEYIAYYCRKENIKYTRYADDLAFSGNLKKDEIIEMVEFGLGKLGLNLNTDKTNFMQSTQQQVISRVIVNKKTQVPKNKRNKIRNSMYYIKNYGIDSHLERITEEKSYYLKNLMGQVNYIVTINSKDEEFLEYRKILSDLIKENL